MSTDPIDIARITLGLSKFKREMKNLRRALDRTNRKMKRFAVAANRRPALIHKGSKP